MKRACWLAIFALLSLAEFLVKLAKEHAEEQIKGKPREEPNE